MNIPIPPNLILVSGDAVSYEISGSQVSQTFKNVICYHQSMKHLATHSFDLTSNLAASILSEEMFQKWIELCQENYLVSENAKIGRADNKNTLKIPRTDCKHIMYSTLCCYRWAENQSPLVYTVLKLLEKHDYLNFYQAFFYACGQYVMNVGHSFHPVGKGYGGLGKLQINSMFATHHFFKNIKKYQTDSYQANTTWGAIWQSAQDKKADLNFTGPPTLFLNKNLSPLFEMLLTKACTEIQQLK